MAVAKPLLLVVNEEWKWYNQKRVEFAGEVMQEIIENFAEENHIDIIRIVDITSLSLEENRGYSCAILLAKVLPKEYIDNSNFPH